MTEPAADAPLHVVVVGAGIAGLAAAHRLRTRLPNARVTVLEGSPQVGGKLLVSEVGGVPVDEGAEAILNRRPEGVDLIRAVGLADALVHPATTGAGVWTRGTVRPMPPTLMGVPSDLWALARSGIVSPAGLARAQLDRVLPPARVGTGAPGDPDGADAPGDPGDPDGADVAVGALVTARLGREVNDRLLEPLLGGVYAGHARELSLRAAAPQIAALLDRGRSLLAAARAARTRQAAPTTPQPPVFAGIRGGVGRLPGVLVAACGARVRTDAPVRALQRTEHGWTLVVGPTRAEEAVGADAVVVAVPAPAAARLLRPHAPVAADRLGEVDYASVALVAFAFDRSAVAGSLTGSGFLVPPVDRRLVKAATYSSNKWAWVAAHDRSTVVVRTSVGRHREERDLQRDDAELAAAALADLQAATGITARPLDTRVTRWGGGLPQYTVGHLARVAAIRADLVRLPGVAVCGAAYDGLGIPACISSADAAVTRIVDDLRRRGRISA